MIPLSTITTGLIAKSQAGSASGLFNMLRNMGGSVGIAVLSTLMSVREKFHSAKLVEGVTIYSHETVERLALYKNMFIAKGFDAHTAGLKSLAAMDVTIRKQAHVMSFNDCFLFVCGALLLSSVLVLLCDRVGAPTGPSEAH
jgi:DHA2 family multidrug resistance protein